MFGYKKPHFGIKYVLFLFLFSILYLCLFFSFVILFFIQYLAKKTYVLQNSTIFELNIVINVNPNSTEPLPIVANYIKS